MKIAVVVFHFQCDSGRYEKKRRELIGFISETGECSGSACLKDITEEVEDEADKSSSDSEGVDLSKEEFTFQSDREDDARTGWGAEQGGRPNNEQEDMGEVSPQDRLEQKSETSSTKQCMDKAGHQTKTNQGGGDGGIDFDR
ncbi:hypothetical protein NDU88_003746 [Pleurodeles waltl]|uniref:Uncharacterized protein n=1 Tax=Pleurodeles waltl TaxID=8319 RepID=A0AAV7MUC0_PLEWA|nr:hypothetical protein NDU88_003746 [Pleurodeles waltl]